MTDQRKLVMTGQRKLVMSVSLNALEHLGINLYSNIPAVLSEIVANAWDADAKLVTVNIDKKAETITIQDDGIGMGRNDVIDRFLTVGFRRRDALGEKTPSGRNPMGRKGIGKLSMFSVAQVADIYTIHDGKRTAFRMDRNAIRKAIDEKNQDNYNPDELDDDGSPELTKGTRIVLSKISKSLFGMTVEGLRRRVARRFSVIGPKNNFIVCIDGAKIGPEDRAYHTALQYIWTYRDQSEFVGICKKLNHVEDRSSQIKSELAIGGISLSGWIGTVANPRHLKGEDGDNLNRIAIFMRGKMAQEDVLNLFGQKEIYADYIVGELNCEELDVDDKGDIATSSRQSLKEDDPRYEALRKTVLSELRHVANRWSNLRRSGGVKAAMDVPAVSEWLKHLQGDHRRKAERWIGRLNIIRFQDDLGRKELLKASILAFENYRHKEELDSLEEIKDEGLDQVLRIFKNVDDLETSYYGRIVRGRLAVIEALQNKIQENDKEHIIREYIFDHLWLLDPGWERVKGTEYMETQVNNWLKKESRGLKENEKKARIDIGYRTMAGKHIIIELKRPDISTPVDYLVKQIRKYRDGTKKLLGGASAGPIEIICLVGKPPPEWDDFAGTGQQGVIDSLKSVNARIVFYNDLLKNSEAAYADYLDAHKKRDRLWKVFEEIENFSPEIPNDTGVGGI